ncbi:MAG: hypothetical protein AAFY88_14080 [Acidobacteriota bacterium]
MESNKQRSGFEGLSPTRIARWLLTLSVACLGATAATARALPIEPVSISAADRATILDLIGVHPDRVRAFEGWTIRDGFGAVSTPRATVYEVTDPGQDGVAAGRRVTCWVEPGSAEWTCPEDSRLDLLIVELPPTCRASGATGAGDFLSVLPEFFPSPAVLPEIIDVVCTSDVMAKESWDRGEKLMEIRTFDGVLQVSSIDAGQQNGRVFQLTRVCPNADDTSSVADDAAPKDSDSDDPECPLVATAFGYWMA